MVLSRFSYCIWIIPAALVVVSGCSSVPRQDVELQQDAFVRVGSGPAQAKKKGSILQVQALPVYIESPGFVGVLIPPPRSVASKIRVALRPAEQWGGEVLQKRNNLILNEVMTSVSEIQMALGSDQPKEALFKADELYKKYPNLSFLKFLKASCLVVMGDRKSARVLLESALAELPNNASALALYKSLSGRDYQDGSTPQRTPASRPASTAVKRTNVPGGKR